MGLVRVLLVLGGIGASIPASAAPATVDGVTFSDELGGFVLERVDGHGSLDDPFIVTEQLTSQDGGVLVIRASPTFGNHIASFHSIGLALTKVVENRTDRAWPSFEIELQSKLGTPSDDQDGLSFGQGSTAGRPFTSTSFARVEVLDRPYDRITLTDGKVPVGAQTVIRFVLSESVPLQTVYLVQRPGQPIVERAVRPSDAQWAALSSQDRRPGRRP